LVAPASLVAVVTAVALASHFVSQICKIEVGKTLT